MYSLGRSAGINLNKACLKRPIKIHEAFHTTLSKFIHFEQKYNRILSIACDVATSKKKFGISIIIDAGRRHGDICAMFSSFVVFFF